MPPRKRSTQRKPMPDLTTLSDGQIDHLWFGNSTFGFGDVETFTAAYRQHREWLFWGFVGEQPAHRPFCWWLLTHRKERPILNDFIGPVAIAQRRAESFGYLHTDISRGPNLEEHFQEPEPLYLRRLGLVKPREWVAYEQWQSGTGEYAEPDA